MERVCDECGRYIDDKENLFIVDISIIAEPKPIDLDGLMKDPEGTAELEKLLIKMNNMTPEEVAEANDEVHEEYELYLCRECRGEWHRRLKNRDGLIEEEGQ